MFTGLVQALGAVRSIEARPSATRIVVTLGGWDHRPELGASISVNGCCLTVAAAEGGSAPTLAFDVGGHVVLGHVDGLAEVVGLSTAGEWRVRLLLPGELGRYAVDKGSITLDGVSLTIARVEEGACGTVIDVCLIPETLARTNLGARVIGDRVHVEADYLAKLVARQLEWLRNR